MKGWRNLPPALLAMFAIELVGLVVFLTFDLFHSPDEPAVRLSLVGNGLSFMMLAAAVCTLWATVLMARLCALAADSLQSEPGLLTATLRP